MKLCTKAQLSKKIRLQPFSILFFVDKTVELLCHDFALFSFHDEFAVKSTNLKRLFMVHNF